jgi:hypothetical protein
MSWSGLLIGIQVSGLETLPWDRYLLLVVTAWCLFMALSAVALVVSSIVSRVGIATAIGTIRTLLTYVLDVIPLGVDSPLAWLNPWHHYFPPDIIAGGSPGWTGVMILLGWTGAATFVAAALYGRRDLV